IPRERVITIQNGFDAERSPLDAGTCDGVVGPQLPSPRGFTLSHVGTVIPRNRPDLFFRAIASAPNRERWRAESLRIRFVGNLSPSVAARPEFAGLIETTGMVPHSQAWREMSSADALLLLVGDYVARWGHNAKVFEYLRAGRPILCLEESSGSNDRRLLEAFAPSSCVFGNLSDASAIANAIDAVVALAKE